MRKMLIALILTFLCAFAGCGVWESEDETIPEPSPVVTPDSESDGSEIVTGEEADNVAVSDVFWLSDNGTLHNSLCRWYKKSGGSEWDGKAEHVNCQNCGGETPIVHRWNLENK